ncbi:MAG: sigma-70 family RNA polymerase sigma factor [Roseobacter sp.]
MPISRDFNHTLRGLMPALTRRAHRLANSADDAQDLVQDTVLQVLQTHQTGKHIEHLPRYCMTILRHQAYRNWRKTSKMDVLEPDVATVPPDAPLRLACAETQEAIRKLPDAQAELMLLIVSGETQPARLAELTKAPLGTVMSRLARARASLRTDLGVTAQQGISGFLF